MIFYGIEPSPWLIANRYIFSDVLSVLVSKTRNIGTIFTLILYSSISPTKKSILLKGLQCTFHFNIYDKSSIEHDFFIMQWKSIKFKRKKLNLPLYLFSFSFFLPFCSCNKKHSFNSFLLLRPLFFSFFSLPRTRTLSLSVFWSRWHHSHWKSHIPIMPSSQSQSHKTYSNNNIVFFSSTQ